MDDARKLRVVVADDDALLRLDARETLEAAGFEVLEACDAPSALAEFQSHDVDVLFTDVQMPGPFCGLDLARRVHERWPDVRLFVTSGEARLSDADLPDSGRFFTKPYHLDAVVDEMRASLL